MDLSVPCLVEGRSELRNAGRVNCKTHWPFLGCGTPYLLNEFVTWQFSFKEFAVRLVECSLKQNTVYGICALSLRNTLTKSSVYAYMPIWLIGVTLESGQALILSHKA